MAESSAKKAAELPKSRGKPISSSENAGSGPRHLRQMFKSFRKKHLNPASSKASSSSSLNASLPTEKEGGDKRSGYELASRGLAIGKRPGSSSGAGSAQASYLTLRSGDASMGAGRDYDLTTPVAELWNHAYEQLREKEPKLIENYEEEISRHVSTMVGATVAISGLGKVRRREQMEALVKQKLQEDEDGKWRIPLGNDRIAIRDLARYVVSIVDWGKDFVGTTLESSPYGSIAWTGVCLLLPLILNPSKQRASNISGLEYISDLLSRCTMYEHAYCQRYEINRDGSSSEPDLACGGYKSALNELYIRILGFQARSVCQLSRNLVSGGIRAMFKMDDWDSLLECIKLQEASCQTFFDSVKDQAALDAREEGHKQRTSLLLDKLGELNLGIKGIRDKLDEIHVTDEESKCFETLRTSNYLARKDLNPERLSGTCNWFFDHPKYQRWIGHTSTSRLLWVSANPGCGKSVLAKALVDQYDRGSVCYYFFKDDTVITRSAAHAVCAILHQICDLRPDLIRYVLPMHRKNGRKLVDSFEDLWSIFVDITSDKDFGTVVCILDALDECSEDDQKKLLQRLADISNSSTSIKVLITSRPYKSIEAALFHTTGLDKNEIRLSGEARVEQCLIEEEIDIFVKFKVQAFQKLRESNEISDDVHEKLQSYLDGVQNRTYLWVSAVFNELEKDVDAPGYILMDIIIALPDSVDKAYENILNKSTKSKRPILTTVLHIMLAAFRPLSLVEMNLVLSIRDRSSGPKYNELYTEESFGKWLRDLCGFFVNIVDNELYFAHQTAREFLLENDGNQPAVGWKHAFQLTSSHTLLAQICLDYLLLRYDGHRNDSFERYATIHWSRHCQSLEVDQSLAEKVKFFLFQNTSVAPSFERWTTVIDDFLHDSLDYHRHRGLFYGKMVLTDPPPSPLSLACYFGWSSVLIILNTFSDFDWNKKNKLGLTGLRIAAQNGHSEVVKLLLNAGAEVNICDIYGGSALFSAVGYDHLEIVKLLLDAGADVDLQDHKGGTALFSAVGYDHLEIVKLLLDAGADVDLQDHKGGTALHLAVLRAHVEVVKLLLTARADANIRDLYGQTALYQAASIGNLEIVKLLLTAGADANLQEHDGKTTMYRAVSYGRLEIVKLLLSAGADVNLQEHDGKTTMYRAVSYGRLEIVKLLLSAGADVNIRDSDGVTALHRAVSHGHSEIVKVLLDAGADVNIQDDDGTTALHRAVARHHLEIVKLLSTAGANINIQDRVGDTALRYAAFEGQLEIVKLLLTAGADVNARSDEESPLHTAEKRNHIEIAETLLAAGAVDSPLIIRMKLRSRSNSMYVNSSETELSDRDAASDSVSDSEWAPYILESKDFEFGDGYATNTHTTDSTSRLDQTLEDLSLIRETSQGRLSL